MRDPSVHTFADHAQWYESLCSCCTSRSLARTATTALRRLN
jgi:hypothetical protein